jgi:hypothetical protein
MDMRGEKKNYKVIISENGRQTDQVIATSGFCHECNVRPVGKYGSKFSSINIQLDSRKIKEGKI